MTYKKAPIGLVTVEEFSRERAQSVDMAIERIKSGVYKGKEIDGEWFLEKSELRNDFNSSSQVNSYNTSSNANVKKAVFIFIGAFLGLLIVRSFFLEPIEELGWRMFWEGLFEGKLTGNDMEKVSQSSTLLKSIAGIVVGGFVGAVTQAMLSKDQK